METSRSSKTAAPAPEPAPTGSKVRALKMGYYGLARRKPGDVFTLTDDAMFSPRWMERVDPSTPEVRSTGQDMLANRQVTLPGKLSGRDRPPTGMADPLGGRSDDE